MEEHIHQRISQLEQQLKQAHDDLKSDEEIFTDKEKEIASLKELSSELEAKLSLANRYLETSFSKEKEQQELMLQLQMQLDKLMQERAHKQQQQQQQQQGDSRPLPQSPMSTPHKQHDESSGSKLSQATSTGGGGGGGAATTKHQTRSKTAPHSHATATAAAAAAALTTQSTASHIHKQMPTTPTTTAAVGGERAKRMINSSPAVFYMERIMQSFRARSQLLAETLEESDSVLQNKLNSTFEVERAGGGLETKPTDDGDDDVSAKPKTKKRQQQQQQQKGGEDVDNQEQDDNDEEGDSYGEHDEAAASTFVRKGTFKVTKPRSRSKMSEADFMLDAGQTIRAGADEAATGKKTATGQAQPATATAAVANVSNLHEANKKIRDLNINIRFEFVLY